MSLWFEVIKIFSTMASKCHACPGWVPQRSWQYLPVLTEILMNAIGPRDMGLVKYVKKRIALRHSDRWWERNRNHPLTVSSWPTTLATLLFLDVSKSHSANLRPTLKASIVKWNNTEQWTVLLQNAEHVEQTLTFLGPSSTALMEAPVPRRDLSNTPLLRHFLCDSA